VRALDLALPGVPYARWSSEAPGCRRARCCIEVATVSVNRSVASYEAQAARQGH
jgi:hypothetical protein